MKILAAGVQRVQGTSKAGNPFDMCNLICLTPVENVQNPKVKIQGFGFQQMQIALDNSVLPEFAGVKFPGVIDVVVEPRPNMGRMESTIVGLTR